MSVMMRIFLVQDDGSIKPLSMEQYERLQRGDAEVRLTHYAGRTLRYAVVMLETEDDRPVQILRIQYPLLYIDQNGCIDAEELERERKLAVEVFPLTFKGDWPERVVDARHRFARKRFERSYRWKPTPEIEASIIRAVFRP